ncbi:MAG TPA: hypothetical protein VK395_35545 [Gemmataceae bacterium]|nr:hypothetical protein [Gemmataceae bacterium]
MFRRRRVAREIPFSFDSFLDIVANVVGIIIRLILVVWVGARSYSSVQPMLVSAAPAEERSQEARPSTDPLQDELARHRQELAAVQERLLAQLRQLEEWREAETRSKTQLASLSARDHQLEQERQTLQKTAADQEKNAQGVALTSAELRRRSQKLAEEIRALEKQPALQQTLRYRTPVSHPVQSEELLFECNNGRATFIDIAGLLNEVRQGLEEKTRLLRNQWEVHGVTNTVGAFRLHYTLERQRELLDSIGANSPPVSGGNYRTNLSEWQIEPVALNRGENLAEALASGSDFRQIADAIDSQTTAVTFWIYPDSFAIYRQLRDYLYDHDVTVAGRPLPHRILIGMSRHGTVSRGQ